MSKKLIAGIGCAGVFILGLMIVVFTWLGYNREEIAARNSCDAQLGQVENVLDNMWKNFQEIGGVANKERETAMQLFVNYAEARTEEGQGQMMAWIKEQNPTLDSSLYLDLQARLTAGRQDFSGSQKRMLELVRAHSDIVKDPWKSIFLSDSSVYDFEVISSQGTKQAVETGEDERVFKIE